MKVKQNLVAKYCFILWKDWGYRMDRWSRTMLLIVLVLFSGCAARSESGSLSCRNLYVAAWLWRSAGLNTFCNTKYIRIFSEINPVWYTTTADGSAINGSVNQTVINWAKNYGVKLIPTLQKLTRDNTNPDLATSTLDDLKRPEHIAKIVALVVNNDFAGIDIDYETEGLSTVDRTNFVTFVKDLKAALQARDKLLSVCVYDRQSMAGWQDWSQMTNYVDSLKVMVYNCDLTDNPKPNPISPLSGLKATLQYAASLAEAKGKIIIGLPFFGRDWSARTTGAYNKTAVYYTGATVQNGINNNSVWRNDGEPYFTYKDSASAWHTVYFQDATALAKRLKLIAQYTTVVKGVTFWDLGGEDPLSWIEIAKY
jgi:spore germination protein